MSEELVVMHCSPTLAKLKTGNMFSCRCECKEELFKAIRALNKRLVPKGLRLLPLKYSDGLALIYLFRPSLLARDLSDSAALTILEQAGYQSVKPEHSIRQLIRRLDECKGFPHEIGLFLGYPPEDVKGFIEHKGAQFKFAGLWKVYGDEHAARRRFESYLKCTESYQKQLAYGKSVEHLAIA